MTTRRVLATVLAATLAVAGVACDPDGLLDSAVGVAGSSGKVIVSGWAYDSDVPEGIVSVRIDIDYVPAATVAANRSRPDVASAKGIRDTTGFMAEVAANPGSRIVCVHALNVAGTDGKDSLIGCAFVTVPSDQPVAHQLLLTTGSGTAPYSEGLKWVISDPQGDRVNCRIDWDGGAWDESIPNCHSRIGATHTFTAPGTYQVALEMADGNSAPKTEYRTVVVTGPRTETYAINIRDNGGFSPTQAATFTDAATRWSGVLAAGLAPVSLNVPANDCEPGLPSFTGTVDDLMIDIIAKAIDGSGGVLAAAGPCYVRKSNGLPVYGVMIVDSADIDRLETEGILADVAMHEMGHVLGIGTIWEEPPLVGAATNDPRFEGWMASIAANEWFTGWTSVPVENTGGEGTALAHWRETSLDNELMTGFADPTNVLSAITIGSLEDIGYLVDLRAAETLDRPSFRDRAASAEFSIEERLIRPVRSVG